MKASEQQLLDILSYLLPPEIFTYFEIVKSEHTSHEVHIYLDEQNIIPEEYAGHKHHSKGFHETSIIQDFPLRDKALYLHVRRRRWELEETRAIISRDWNIVAHGTRYSEGFASFLKGLLGYLPHQQQQS